MIVLHYKIPLCMWMQKTNVPRSVMCGLVLRTVSISFAFGSLLTNRAVGPMKRGTRLRYMLSFRKDLIT